MTNGLLMLVCTASAKVQRKAAECTKLSHELTQFLRRGLKDNEKDLMQVGRCSVRLLLDCLWAVFQLKLT